MFVIAVVGGYFWASTGVSNHRGVLLIRVAITVGREQAPRGDGKAGGKGHGQNAAPIGAPSWSLSKALHDVLGRGKKGSDLQSCGLVVQARKRHINMNFLVRLLLGHHGNVPGTNRVCPREKVGLSQGQTRFSPYHSTENHYITSPYFPELIMYDVM